MKQWLQDMLSLSKFVAWVVGCMAVAFGTVGAILVAVAVTLHMIFKLF